jgi:hypothetical protein
MQQGQTMMRQIQQMQTMQQMGKKCKANEDDTPPPQPPPPAADDAAAAVNTAAAAAANDVAKQLVQQKQIMTQCTTGSCRSRCSRAVMQQ